MVDNADGSPVHPERLTQYFDRVAVRLGVEGVTLHALRHFAISTWLRAGVPVLVVSRMAGHAKASFTIDTYGHCIPEDQDAAVAAMDRALAGVEV